MSNWVGIDRFDSIDDQHFYTDEPLYELGAQFLMSLGKDCPSPVFILISYRPWWTTLCLRSKLIRILSYNFLCARAYNSDVKIIPSHKFTCRPNRYSHRLAVEWFHEHLDSFSQKAIEIFPMYMHMLTWFWLGINLTVLNLVYVRHNSCCRSNYLLVF